MPKKKGAPASPFVPEEEQPYPIPENWCWTTVDKVAMVITGGTPSKKNPEYYGDKFPFFKPTDLDAGRHVFTASEYLSERGKSIVRIIPSKSTAVCCIGSIGKSGYLEIEGTTNQQINSAIPKFNSLYLFYFMNTDVFINQLWSKSSATTISIVNKSKMESCYFPLAPLLEQHRIVSRIESLFSKLDEAKEKAQAVVDGFELRKSAILHKAFTGELTERWRKEHGVGLDSWTKRKLKNCGDWCGGGTPSMAHPEYWDGGDLLWITSKDMKSDIIEDTLLHTNMAGVNNSSANYIERPSVLFVMRSGILRRTLPIAMVKVPFTVNQDLKAVSPVNDLDLEYFFWVCKSAEKRMLGTCMKNGTTVESINTKTLMEFEIPVASQSEQREIVNCIIGLLDKEQQAKSAAEAVLTQIDAMKKAILARAFRGELGTNNPEEASAAEMLNTVLGE